MLRTADLDYHLPDDLIATHPASPRDDARLMVVSRSDPSLLLHRRVRDLPEFLRAGDALVLNSTRVLPARFRGERSDTGGKVDGLYLAPPDPGASSTRWAVLLKGRRIKPGVRVTLHDRDGRPCGLALRILERHHEEHHDAVARGEGLPHEHEPESGGWLATLERDDAHATPDTPSVATPAAHILEQIGLTPLPPYIRQARKRHEEPAATEAQADESDRQVYQTVYADPSRTASVAAPTAGLHFTPELLARIESLGVKRAEVVLHVGMGTFKPVETEFIEQHPMHAEWCEIPGATAALLNAVRTSPAQPRGRIFAVGTTSARTLESLPVLPPTTPPTPPLHGWTRILITPGHAWRNLDGLMTNFHLPRSTLMAMVASLFPDGVQRLQTLYAEAVRERYRFYSYGDAMLILP